ncbi:MAG: cyanophycin synthetase [Deltaproteobacteria bacterium]|nr:cyanophycin synthetase [Deltaproteobacteria bacterium]
MDFLNILALRGPNFWSRRTVLEAWVDLGELRESPSNGIPGLYDRLVAWLPGLIEHRCGLGVRGGFLERLKDGTYPAHILEHVTLELQTLAGTPVGFGKARETSTPGVYKVAVRYREEAVGRACLAAARELLLAAIYNRPFDLAAEVKRLTAVAEEVCLGPSTMAIVTAAEARGIPYRRLTEGSLVQLGVGAKQRRIWTAETDTTSAIAESIAQDKDLTRNLLASCGVPVPEGRAVDSPADAWAAACEVGLPVVVKPRDGNHGRAVFTELESQEQIVAAYATALGQGSGVIVEQFIRGNEHRLLVVGDRMVAAARGETAWVTGDGEQSVQQLIESQLNADPRRGLGDDCPLNPVEIDEVTILELARQGHTTLSVPKADERILIQRNGNVAFDVTDSVHPSVAEQVVTAAKVIGLDIAGIDLVAEDVSRPLALQRGAVIEVNSSPGLHVHLKPASGKPRPVGEAIVDRLFAAGDNGRIPIVCVTGTNGKTSVTRLVAHILRSTGLTVGMACSDGLFLGRRLIDPGDCAGPKSAKNILLNPAVEAAVLEAGRGGILREGLGFDRCQVAVVTNIGDADHLGRSFIDTPEEMFTVKRCPVDVVLDTGAAVLNAADPLVAEMASLCAGSVIFFAPRRAHPVIESHLEAGKRAVFVNDGQVTVADGERQTPVIGLDAVPLCHGGRVGFQVENVLAGTAAAWALGVELKQIQAALASFARGPEDAPGRFGVFEHDGKTVVIDDCHNTSAVRALVAALGEFPADKRSIAFSAGARRRDADIIRQGEALGAAFDRVILYDDASAFDRKAGEIPALVRRGLAKSARPLEIIERRAHAEAVHDALQLTKPGDLVVLQTEDSHPLPTLELFRQWTRPQPVAATKE